MRFLIVGLGSMGRRRIRNLQYLRAGDLAGFDPREDRRAEATSKYGVPAFDDFDEALDVFDPEAFIISTPPDLHMRYAKIAVESDRHCFCEASVVDDEMMELIALCREHPNVVVAPSCTMRYYPSVQTIKRIVDGKEFGRPLLFTYHVGQWLPDWHPWEDYRTFYVGKRETGGCREIVPFELSWLTWLLGPVEAVAGMRGKLSTLDAPIDDAYQLLLKFRSGAVGHLLVDVIARAPVRAFRLLSEQTTVEWDAMARQVRVYRAATQKWEAIPEPKSIQEHGYVFSENPYFDEMRDFIAACQGQKPWSYPLDEDKTVLEILAAAERSSDSGSQVRLPC